MATAILTSSQAIDEMILATYELDAAFDRRDAPATLGQLNRLKTAVEAYKRLARRDAGAIIEAAIAFAHATQPLPNGVEAGEERDALLAAVAAMEAGR